VRGSLVGTTCSQTHANRARNRRRDRRAIYRRILWIIVAAQLSWISGSPGAAQDVSKEQMQGLDEQVQEIKSDVLSIAAELSGLEEKLLYPSSTQVAIFVSLAEGESLRLDSVQIQIDGAPVARHIYSFKELEALQKGGVQRIYTGNVSTGEHRLVVSVAGKLSSGTDLAATESFSFSKDVEPKLVGLTLAGGDSSAASIRLGAW
jgi:hypothetical protein